MWKVGTMVKYTRAKLIDCLTNEYAYYCHEDGDEPDVLEEYVEELHKMNYEELVKETWTDTDEELKEYVDNYQEQNCYRTDLNYDKGTS